MKIERVAEGKYRLVCANGFSFTGTYSECRKLADDFIWNYLSKLK